MFLVIAQMLSIGREWGYCPIEDRRVSRHRYSR